MKKVKEDKWLFKSHRPFNTTTWWFGFEFQSSGLLNPYSYGMGGVQESVWENHKEETVLHVFWKQTNSAEVICKKT